MCTIFCVEIGMHRPLKQGFRMEGVAKNHFRKALNSSDIGLHFLRFLVSLRTLCMTFGDMGACLESHDFFGVARKDP